MTNNVKVVDFDQFREKLIESLRDVQYLGGLEEKIADHLIANVVTVPDTNVGKWISVKDRLPEVAITHNNRWEKSTESVHVLCYCKQNSGKRMVKEGSCKVYASGTIYWMIPGTIDSVTHWMPLPQPPKGE